MFKLIEKKLIHDYQAIKQHFTEQKIKQTKFGNYHTKQIFTKLQGMINNIHFIVGSGRCGTNLLNNMLRCHPDILPITETHFISTLATKINNQKLSFEAFWNILDQHYTSKGDKKWIDIHLEAGNIFNKKAFKQHFQNTCKQQQINTNPQRISTFFQQCYKSTKHSTIIDKTPQYGLHMSAIAKFFPQAKFIHLIRDGRFVATSMTKHLGICKLIHGGHPEKLQHFSYQGQLTHLPAKSATLKESIQYWKTMVKATQKESKQLAEGYYLEIRYEDLIITPKKIIQQISDFLSLPQKSFWQWRASLLPRPDAFNKEIRRLSAQEYEQLTHLSKNMLEEFGYFTQSHIKFQQHIKNLKLENQKFRKTWNFIFPRPQGKTNKTFRNN